MGATPNYGFVIPEVGEPGWGLTLNTALCDVDEAIYDVAQTVTAATSGYPTLNYRLDTMQDEVKEARDSEAFGVDYANLSTRIEEGDAQIQYAKGPFIDTGGEQLRDALAKFGDGSTENANIGNTNDTDMLDTESIVECPGAGVVAVDGQGGTNYFNINGKIYSITSAVSGSFGASGYVVLSPPSSDAGETDLQVQVTQTADLQNLDVDDLPVGWIEHPSGATAATFTKNKVATYVFGGTITPGTSAVCDIVIDHTVNLGFPPDSIDVIAKFQNGSGQDVYISNPPSVQVQVKRGINHYLNRLSVMVRKVICPMNGDTDYLGVNRVLYYDADEDTEVNTFTGLKVTLSYWGRPWRDSTREDF